MIAKVTEQGLLLTPDLLQGAKEVQIWEESGKLVIVLDPTADPILQLADNPVTVPEDDASVNHDRYIYTR